MKTILRLRWIILISWIAVAAGLLYTAPNMENLVRDKGQVTVPEGYPSTIAEQIVDNHKSKDGTSQSVVIVFHEKEGLSDTDKNSIKDTMKLLESEKDSLGITEITTHFNETELEEQLTSQDGKTILALLGVNFTGKEVQEVRLSLQEAIKTDGVESYMTGNVLISEDVIISSQEGLKKTELITVVFILFVLVIVFRSVVAPLIPLVTVGFTYVISQSIVAYLVDKLDFPLSNFTQIFLVAVLFGIGTDYCILLLSRFKEELSQDVTINEAILNTYKTAGRTVIYSGLAVLVGFASIGFATFKLYQSAAAVAVGVAILLIALMTIVPFFMAVLGKKIFWPVKGSISHSQSKLWGFAGHLSITKPIMTLLIVAALIVPLLLKYDGSLSFNSLDEIGDEYNSVKAFNVISESFGPGESLPAKVVIQHDQSMKNTEYLTLIEKISREVDSVNGIEKVRSATRPVGEEVDELYVNSQVDQLSDGIGEGNEAIMTIQTGLAEAADGLKSSSPQMDDAVKGIESLVSGTVQLQTGIGDLQNGLIAIQEGVKKGSLGASELQKGVVDAKVGAQKLAEGSKKLLEGYESAASGLLQLQQNYVGVTDGLSKLKTNLATLNKPFENLLKDYPELAQNQDFLTIQGSVQYAVSALTEMELGLTELNKSLATVQGGVSVANKNMMEVIKQQTQLAAGLGEVVTGLEKLEEGLNAAAGGQGQIISQIPQVKGGLGKIATGQSELSSGISELVDQLGELTEGLSQSADGLQQIGDGLGEAKAYLDQLAQMDDKEMAGFYIPKEVLQNEEFNQVFNVYMSEDGTMTTIDVVMQVNPYSNEALQKVNDIRSAVVKATKDTKLEGAQLGISGVSSMYNDLQNISDADYSRTVVFMLIGIGIILIVLMRSLVMPIYILASLLITYFSSVAITELIFVNILGYPGVNWAVPFFGFVILMALGVDYSIFLMDRFNEYKDMSVEKALMLSMRNMGTVIMSAVIILAGTFAAMLPSGVLSLLQIATLVLSGLLLYALVVLPLFVPVMVKLFGRANWWPFYMKR